VEISNPNQSDNGDGQNGSSIGRRFVISYAWTFAALELITLTTSPKSAWLFATIGSGILALLGGVIAMAIKTSRKIVYVPISLLICFIVAYIIGSNTGS